MKKDDIRKRVPGIVRSLPKGKQITKIALFGSYLHGNSTQHSDIDLLFEYTGIITLFDIVDMKRAFEKDLGTEVDLVTPEALSEEFRNEVLTEAQTVYEER